MRLKENTKKEKLFIYTPLMEKELCTTDLAKIPFTSSTAAP